jgi:hypothetical protein
LELLWGEVALDALFLRVSAGNLPDLKPEWLDEVVQAACTVGKFGVYSILATLFGDRADVVFTALAKSLHRAKSLSDANFQALVDHAIVKQLGKGKTMLQIKKEILMAGLTSRPDARFVAGNFSAAVNTGVLSLHNPFARTLLERKTSFTTASASGESGTILSNTFPP